MEKISLKRIAIALGVLFISYLAFTKLRPSKDDREYLLRLPAIVADLAEQRQGAEIRRYISKDYRDDKNRTYQDLNGLIIAHTLRQGEISIYTLNPDVEMNLADETPKAKISFNAVLARGKKEASVFDVLPDRASIYDFVLNLEKTDDGWQVKSGTWEPSTLD